LWILPPYVENQACSAEMLFGHDFGRQPRSEFQGRWFLEMRRRGLEVFQQNIGHRPQIRRN
jgi:hypothetical protein